MHRWFPVLALLLVLLGGCAKKGPQSAFDVEIVSTGRDPREIYAHGEKMLKAGLYEKALADFQELRNFHRDDPLSVRAQLALAEIRFKKSEFDEARYAYEEFLQYHPRHPDLDYVVYRIGLSIWKRAPKLAGRDQSLTRAATTRWAGFADRFPQSEYKEEVTKLYQRGLDRMAAKELWVARYYHKRGKWRAVGGRAELVVDRFPTSRHAPEALSLLARSYHRQGLVADAQAAQARLAEVAPDSRWLTLADRMLARPPGTPDDEPVFPRPYRISGFQPGPQGGGR